jgi:hypothetical protein
MAPQAEIRVKGVFGENATNGFDHLVSFLLCIILVSTIALVSWGTKEKIQLGCADVGTDKAWTAPPNCCC